MRHWQRWWPDVAAGLLVLLVGVLEVFNIDPYYYVDDPRPGLLLIVVGIALAVSLSRRLPAAALAVVWVVCALQVVTGTQLLMVELAIAAVAFGTARWGSLGTVWLSALSIPLAAVITVYWIDSSVFYAALDTAGFRELIRQTSRFGDRWQVTAAVAGMAVLGVPWLAGLALRFSARADQSRASQVVAEAERDQAEEIARLREEQAQLARDVHDVVGHSLAVILAQAESAQYLEDADTQRLKQTMANIATSARSSLDDVRQVLASTAVNTSGVAPRARPTDLDSLVDGVRASGHEVVTTEVGAPQPMPPELEVVAFRVLQEMLTNAIKHGRRDRPVLVERHWEGDLRIEVRNTLGPGGDETRPIALPVDPAAPTDPAAAGGQGIDGMRRRLDAVGGRLDVRRRTDPPTFTATAWVPVRTRR
ncbi:histidine kinase [Nocardioides sp. YIM 152315]|uniref:sensor histidine kinase n=1 Tax=Nocardioides sp. YIM 152315 TaxID=3031760 RepID=UPI0023DA092D|nr:histidine kinase [Nocardioides sp. YIM 152315]MDF1605551.1 histidine kinase [Nocardioides sp. YIM 152315]